MATPSAIYELKFANPTVAPSVPSTIPMGPRGVPLPWRIYQRGAQYHALLSEEERHRFEPQDLCANTRWGLGARVLGQLCHQIESSMS